MPSERKDDQPRLLMVSHCVPAAINDRAKSRAWQLLRAAAVRHQVELIAVVDAPVHMEHWRRLAEVASRVTLVSGWLATHAGRVGSTVRQATRWTAYDTVLSTSPRLWSRTLGDLASYRIVDLDVPQSRLLRQRTVDTDPVTRWRLLRRAETAFRCEKAVAPRCDLLILSRRDDMMRFERFANRTALAARHEDDVLAELLTAPPVTLGTTVAAPEIVVPLRRAA